MLDHLGRASVAGALLSWTTFAVGLVFGGLDYPSAPDAEQWLLPSLLAAQCVAVLAVAAAVVAVVRGPQRISATLGLVLALAYIVLTAGVWLPE